MSKVDWENENNAEQSLNYESYSIEIPGGEPINVLLELDRNNVWSPYSAIYYLKIIIGRYGAEYFKGKKILDMGCGTGVIGLALSKLGAEVVMVDSNPWAVSLTARNVTLNSCQNAKVHCTDVFAPLDLEGFDIFDQSQTFDMILGNLPMNPSKTDSSGRMSIAEKSNQNGNDGGEVLRLVISTAMGYLNPEGVVALTASSRQYFPDTSYLMQRFFGHTFEILNSDAESNELLAQMGGVQEMLQVDLENNTGYHTPFINDWVNASLLMRHFYVYQIDTNGNPIIHQKKTRTTEFMLCYARNLISGLFEKVYIKSNGVTTMHRVFDNSDVDQKIENIDDYEIPSIKDMRWNHRYYIVAGRKSMEG